MKKTSHDVWIFPLPSGLQINLRDVPQEDLDFLDGIEQKTTRVAELEAVLRECRAALKIYVGTGGAYQRLPAGDALRKIKEVLPE